MNPFMIIYFSSGCQSAGRLSFYGCEKGEKIRLRGQAVKTSPFHGGNTGSIPVGVTKYDKSQKRN